MSNAVVNLCWTVQIPPVAKAVLMAIADRADDGGEAWPSNRDLEERTCWKGTAVIEAIKYLERAGLVTVERIAGRNNRYRIDLAAVTKPVRDTDLSAKRTGPPNGRGSPRNGPVPVRETDQPVRQPDPNHQEPSKQPSGNHQKVRKRSESTDMTFEDFIADGLVAETAREWIAMRKARRAGLGRIAWRTQLQEAEKAGLSIDQAIAYALGAGWQTFNAEWHAKREAKAGHAQIVGLTGGLLGGFTNRQQAIEQRTREGRDRWLREQEALDAAAAA